MQKSKVGINKVKFRLLEIWPPSVKQGFENETQISDFDNLVKIGEGSFGIVFKATYKKTGATYAIKAIDKRNKTNQEGKTYFKREIEIMYKIRHPNIVRLYTHFEDDSYCYFVMEYISKGNLYDNIAKQRKKCFDAKTVANYMKDLLSAVYYLHSMDPPIIHRDIKLENVLLNEDGVIKLTDFGWSNYIFSDEVRDTFCGTPVYLAPEMIDRKEHDHNVDIWCIGVMMFELITGKLPFNTTNKILLEDSIRNLKINWPSDMNNQVRDLISRILKIEPSKRLQIENIFKHPFFTSNFTNLNDFLIKPNPHDEHNVYIMTENLPLDKEKNKSQKNVTSSVNSVVTPPKEITDVKQLQQALETEQKITKELNTKLTDSLLEKEKIENELKNLVTEHSILKEKNKELESLIEKMENSGKSDITSLEKQNKKLLDEIEILNDRIELHKNYYKEYLQNFDKEMQKNMTNNHQKIDNTVKNIRDSMSTMKINESNNKEIEEMKKNFEKEIDNLKKTMAKERENYNFVLESNMKELSKLMEEKNKIKETSSKYYEKLICKYDLKLKQKDTEIEELKAKLNKK